MAAIDNLEIQITASADEAVRGLQRLASASDRVRSSARGAAGATQDMAQGARDMGTATHEAGEQAGKAERSTRSYGRAAKDAGDNAKKGSSGISTFWQSLKRIAYYRAIRSIIKGITDSFREGISNLYQWSSAVNGTFARSMDRIATSTLYLKNSLGAMLAPIINTLAPVIEWIVDRIVEVINWINKLFAALSGSQTYTVAKKVATTWADAGKSAAGSARKAADDIKRTILGFDEINKLEKQNENSGGGGYGNNSPSVDYTNMFEERKLDGWMAKLASLIDKFNVGIPAVFAGILAGFEAVKLAIKAVSGLSLDWLKDMAGKTINIAVSLVRNGWQTITQWAVGFGNAVVDLAVRIKTSVASLWSAFASAWSALSPVVQVGVVLSVTAAALWAAYKLAWALVPDKVLQVEAAISTTAAKLWNGIKKSWGNAKDHVLSVGLAVATSINSLFDTSGDIIFNAKLKLQTTAAQLKNDIVVAWGKLVAWSLPIAFRVSTTASHLKDSITAAWKLLPAWSLGVALSLSTTAAQLKNNIVVAWNKLVSWSLGVNLSLATTAAQLKNNIVTAWGKLVSWSLDVALRLSTTAAQLKNSIVATWAKLEAWSLGVALRLETSADTLKAGIVTAWSKLAAWSLGVKLSLSTTAAQLKNDIVTAWGKLVAWSLGVKLSLSTTAADLKKSIVDAWNKLAAWSLDVAISTNDKIKTAVSNVWTWVKDNWKLVAAGALGIAIAIATPWSTLATALSGLWADVMASFGGALSFSIIPVFGGFLSGEAFTTGKAAELSPNTSYYDNSTGELVIKAKPTEVEVSAVAGKGFKKDGGGIGRHDQLEVDIGESTVDVGLQKDWLGSPTAELGLDNLIATIATGLTYVSSWLTNPKGTLGYLGIADLTTTISTSLTKDWGTTSVTKSLGLEGLTATIKVKLAKTANNKVEYYFNGGGTDKNVKVGELFRRGGAIVHGRRTNIPQYAGGTTNAHGSLFLAGEAGPEIVGHVGGRTEVLNKSQLASAMFSAVRAALAPAAANFAYAAQAMGTTSSSEPNYAGLYEIIRDAMGNALANDNGNRERNQLLREINDKEMDVEVSTSSINRAQTRMNRRAGTTIVAVGT